MVTALYMEIAEELRRSILSGEYPVGARLPSESDLADRWSASRGTVRQAVALLTSEGIVGSRQGARRIVLRRERRHSFAELHSFAQWARTMGYRSASRFLHRERRRATPEEARRLALPQGATVLDVLRLRCLDDEPVMLERTAYAEWVAPTVESLPVDCASIMDSMAEDAGIVAHYGEHLIDAVPAGSDDARLLRVRRGSPLLRQRHLTSNQDGRPIEWTEDRYRAGSVTFNVSNSVGTAPLVRDPGSLLT